MDDPERLPLDELADWLRYYRALGFTHLYRKRSPQSGSLDGGEALSVPAEEARVDRSQPPPPGNQLYLGTALPTAAPTREAAPRKSAAEPAVPAFSAPPAAHGGTLFDSVAPRETLEQ